MREGLTRNGWVRPPEAIEEEKRWSSSEQRRRPERFFEVNMSRKRTVRRVWQKVNPIEHAMKGASVTPRSDLDVLLVRELSAMADMTRGRASLRQWHDLANVVNLCETLAHERVGAEALESCGVAQNALIEAAKRFQRTQRMGLSGPGIQALRDVIEYHDLQRSSIPRSQYEAAIRLTAARVKSGYATVDLGDLVDA